MYTDSCGYGGLLQAWAMVRMINEMGYNAEQIVLGNKKAGIPQKTIFKKIKQLGVEGTFSAVRWKLKKISGTMPDEKIFAQTKSLCTEFRNSIPHSERYDEDDLEMTNKLYDVFIVGSDQVWNPYWIREAYLLSFVKGRPRISYAASIANFDFSMKEKQRFIKAIEQFDAVSVREKKAVWYIKKFSQVNPALVLDPTLLLRKEHYANIEKEVNVPEKYIFCYFLNMESKKRTLAQKIAEEQKCRIVYPIWYRQQVLYNDNTFGEQTLLEVGPREWLYLIHHASLVLTDSFHALVFSILYQKQFYHIPRTKKQKNDMNSRVDSLLTMLELEERTIDKNNIRSMKYTKINYQHVEQVLESQRVKSFAWLENVLGTLL